MVSKSLLSLICDAFHSGCFSPASFIVLTFFFFWSQYKCSFFLGDSPIKGLWQRGQGASDIWLTLFSVPGRQEFVCCVLLQKKKDCVGAVFKFEQFNAGRCNRMVWTLIYCILTHMQSAIAHLISSEKTPAGFTIIDPPCGIFSIGLQIQCIREIALSVQQKAYSN